MAITKTTRVSTFSQRTCLKHHLKSTNPPLLCQLIPNQQQINIVRSVSYQVMLKIPLNAQVVINLYIQSVQDLIMKNLLYFLSATGILDVMNA